MEFVRVYYRPNFSFESKKYSLKVMHQLCVVHSQITLSFRKTLHHIWLLLECVYYYCCCTRTTWLFQSNNSKFVEKLGVCIEMLLWFVYSTPIHTTAKVFSSSIQAYTHTKMKSRKKNMFEIALWIPTNSQRLATEVCTIIEIINKNHNNCTAHMSCMWNDKKRHNFTIVILFTMIIPR